MKNDTIAAVATPAGHGGIGIIRISGSEVKNEALKILKRIPQPRYAEYLKFYNSNNEIIGKFFNLCPTTSFDPNIYVIFIPKN